MKSTNPHKPVCGIGTNSREYAATDENHKVVKEYRVWMNMLLRCTEKWWVKDRCYSGTSCSENFKSYTFFYEWCNKQVGFASKDVGGVTWNLDKDILLKGNKVYSEDNCVFVPQRINKLLIKCDSSRGEFPVGVHLNKKLSKFSASCNSARDGRIYLGLFNTHQEAFLAYKTFKEALIKEVANEYKDQLDPRAYQALMKYEVNEDD